MSSTRNKKLLVSDLWPLWMWPIWSVANTACGRYQCHSLYYHYPVRRGHRGHVFCNLVGRSYMAKELCNATTRLPFGLFCCTSAIADVWWKRLNGTTRNSECTDGILSYTSHDVCQHRCFTPVSSWLPHSRCNDIVIYRPHDDDVMTPNTHHNSNTCITFTNCVSGNDAFVLEQASSGNFSAVSFKRYCKSQLLILTGLDISNI